MTQGDSGKLIEHDPADTAPAEGGSNDDIPESARGKSPEIDPADKDQPAEGGREESED